MSLSAAITSRLAIVLLLIVVLAGVGWLISMVPSSLARLVASGLIGAGLLNVFLHRSFGRQSFEWSQSLPFLVSTPWRKMGMGGAQALYLGIGMVLVLAGCVLLIKTT